MSHTRIATGALPVAICCSCSSGIINARHFNKPARLVGPGDATADAARRVLNAIAGTADATAAYDERILRAITYINQNLGGQLTLDAVAKEAFLSPTRFRHLFVEQTGTALRPYVLWRRFLRAWSLVRDGASLSAAAHEAGFADAARLTRTSQKMFGFAPSALLVNQRGV